MSTSTRNTPNVIGPDDPGWDSISTFTGKALTQKQREANDRRRAANQQMLAQMDGGLRSFKVNRMVPIGGTQQNPKVGPRSFLVSALSGVDAKNYVQAQIDGMFDALPGRR